MSDLTPLIYYLAAIRLGVIAAGIICITLGYRLFMRALPPSGPASDPIPKEDVSAEIAGTKLTIRNASPGTCFALFGAVIIVAMYITGGPEATLDILEEGRVRATFRGQASETVKNVTWQAVQELKNGDKHKALETASNLLKQLAVPINNLALVLVEADPDNAHSLLLAKLALSIEPHNPEFNDTLNTVTKSITK
jgi:hypothetical protein